MVAYNEYGHGGVSNIESIEIQDSQVSFSGFFSNLNWGEIIILGGFLGALQIIFAIVIVATKSITKASSKSTKGKKK
ncbi:MAG: hypothetical protein KGD64_06085 [Candidatus Heimdallarchaeota archaeon]|nr:hypothetical protein [Candidatus Heimdallarchaeota archaeon]